MKPRVITIDGPAGAGKSTVAKEIAKRFGYLHLDSGAVYRAIGLFCHRRGVILDSEEEVTKCLDQVKVELKENGKVLLNGEDVTKEIRTPEGGSLASKVARFKPVRDFVVKTLREVAKGKYVVTDGRDAGSYIFPNAELKIYLTASAEERAKRRFKELKQKGFKVSYEQVLEEIKVRDESDRNRPFAPLTIPQGAKVLDTTGKTIEEVLDEIGKLIDSDC